MLNSKALKNCQNILNVTLKLTCTVIYEDSFVEIYLELHDDQRTLFCFLIDANQVNLPSDDQISHADTQAAEVVLKALGFETKLVLNAECEPIAIKISHNGKEGKLPIENFDWAM